MGACLTLLTPSCRRQPAPEAVHATLTRAFANHVADPAHIRWAHGSGWLNRRSVDRVLGRPRHAGPGMPLETRGA